MRMIATEGLARRLLADEAAGDFDQADPEDLLGAVERVLDKLRVHLSKRIGQEGFRTLLARALALAKSQSPYLSAVQIGADGSLVGLRGVAGDNAAETQNLETGEDAVAGGVAIVARFLELLITFVGEELTLRLLGAAWPAIALNDAPAGEDQRP